MLYVNAYPPIVYNTENKIYPVNVVGKQRGKGGLIAGKAAPDSGRQKESEFPGQMAASCRPL